MISIRTALQALLARMAQRMPAQSGRPAPEPTLGAFGLLASLGDPHRR